MLTARQFNITDFGAYPSDYLMTTQIQQAIDACHAAGGGEVIIPEGTFRTGSLFLKSNVTLHLQSGAELEASRRLTDYTGDRKWFHAIISAYDADNVGIIGDPYSRINGMNCYDPEGEERYRGPHGIVLMRCTNVTLRGYTVKDSGNWSHALYYCKDMHIDNVRMFGGHDGINIHCCEDTLIEHCTANTGDDAVAGIGNYHCIIRDCSLTSACAVTRFGGLDCLFERCTCTYPVAYGHRWLMDQESKSLSLNDGEKTRHDTNSMFTYYCYNRWEINQEPGNIVFRDCTIDHPGRVIILRYTGRNQWCCYKPLTNVLYENCRITNITKPMYVFVTEDEKPVIIQFRNCLLTAAPEAADQPLGDIFNFKQILFENTTIEGYTAPHLNIRSQGEVIIKGGTPIDVHFQPDPNDHIDTFEEIRDKLAQLPSDREGWEKAAASIPTPDETLWDTQANLYRLNGDKNAHDLWGSILAIFRDETTHQKAIAYRCTSNVAYYLGNRDGQHNLIARDINGELSDIPCGPFALALFLDMPIFARAYMTDFLRSPVCSPIAVAGMQQAITKILVSN